MTYVLITGASSGIGKALALQFAQNKHEIILVGQNQDALTAVREACLTAGARKVLTFSKDLSQPDSAEHLFKEIAAQNLSVEILVNNAGFGVHGPFLQTKLADELRLAHLQVDTLLTLTKLFLPAMVAQKSGKILNIASVYSFSPIPYQAVYGAVKSFMLSFSESLAFELKNSGVSITVVCPGTTQTEFRARIGFKAKNSGMSAERVARESYRALMRRRFIWVPGKWNRFFTLAIRFLPHDLKGFVMDKISHARGLPHHG